MSVIGIDPGLNGGLVVMDKDGFVIKALPLPTSLVELSSKHLKGKNKGELKTQLRIDGLELSKALAPYKGFTVYCEKAAPMFGVGTNVNFRMGHGAGIVEGVCMALDLEWREVSPRTWQKSIWLEADKVERAVVKERVKQGSVDTKATTLNAFKRLNKTVNPLVGRSKKPHDGIIDAFLIAQYGLQQLTK